MNDKQKTSQTGHALAAIKEALPTGSFILLTPHDGMFVSPDPEQIKRSIDVLISQLKAAANE